MSQHPNDSSEVLTREKAMDSLNAARSEMFGIKQQQRRPSLSAVFARSAYQASSSPSEQGSSDSNDDMDDDDDGLLTIDPLTHQAVVVRSGNGGISTFTNRKIDIDRLDTGRVSFREGSSSHPHHHHRPRDSSLGRQSFQRTSHSRIDIGDKQTHSPSKQQSPPAPLFPDLSFEANAKTTPNDSSHQRTDTIEDNSDDAHTIGDGEADESAPPMDGLHNSVDDADEPSPPLITSTTTPAGQSGPSQQDLNTQRVSFSGLDSDTTADSQLTVPDNSFGDQQQTISPPILESFDGLSLQQTERLISPQLTSIASINSEHLTQSELRRLQTQQYQPHERDEITLSCFNPFYPTDDIYIPDIYPLIQSHVFPVKTWQGSHHRSAVRNRRIQVIRFNIPAEHRHHFQHEMQVDNDDDYRDAFHEDTLPQTTDSRYLNTSKSSSLNQSQTASTLSRYRLAYDLSIPCPEPGYIAATLGEYVEASHKSRTRHIRSIITNYEDISITDNDMVPNHGQFHDLPLKYHVASTISFHTITKVLETKTTTQLVRGVQLLTVYLKDAALSSAATGAIPSRFASQSDVALAAAQSLGIGGGKSSGGIFGGNRRRKQIMSSNAPAGGTTLLQKNMMTNANLKSNQHGAPNNTTNNNNNTNNNSNINPANGTTNPSYTAAMLSSGAYTLRSALVNPLSYDEQRRSFRQLREASQFSEACRERLRLGCFVYRYKAYHPTRRFLYLTNNDTALSWRELTSKEEKRFDEYEQLNEEQKVDFTLQRPLTNLSWGILSGFKSVKTVPLDDIQQIFYGPFVGIGFATFVVQCRKNNAKPWYATSIQTKSDTLNFVFLSSQEVSLWLQGLNLLVPSTGRSFSLGKMLWLRVIMKINFIGYQEFVTSQTNWAEDLNTPGAIDLGKS